MHAKKSGPKDHKRNEMKRKEKKKKDKEKDKQREEKNTGRCYRIITHILLQKRDCFFFLIKGLQKRNCFVIYFLRIDYYHM